MLHPTHLAPSQPVLLRRLVGGRRTTPSETRTLEAAYLLRPISQQPEASSVTTHRTPSQPADFLGHPTTLTPDMADLEISNRSSQRLASLSATPTHLRGLALGVQDLVPIIRAPVVAYLVITTTTRPTRDSATINSNSRRQILLAGLGPILRIKASLIPILLLAASARTTNKNRVASLATILRRILRVVCLAAHQPTSSSSLQVGSSVITIITTSSRVAHLYLGNRQAQVQGYSGITTHPVRPTPGAAFSVLASITKIRIKANKTKVEAFLGTIVSSNNSQVDSSQILLLTAAAYSAATTIRSSLPVVRCLGLQPPTISNSSSLEDCLGAPTITTQAC